MAAYIVCLLFHYWQLPPRFFVIIMIWQIALWRIGRVGRHTLVFVLRRLVTDAQGNCCHRMRLFFILLCSVIQRSNQIKWDDAAGGSSIKEGYMIQSLLLCSSLFSIDHWPLALRHVQFFWCDDDDRWSMFDVVVLLQYQPKRRKNECKRRFQHPSTVRGLPPRHNSQ
jgi:hypothetical protein